MEFRKKKSALLIENLGIVFMISFTFLPSNWLFRGILIVVMLLLLKDQIVNRNYLLKTSENGFYEMKGNKENYFPYKKIEAITVSRKYKKYIAVGYDTNYVFIRNSIENREKLVNYIISKSKGNKDIYIDERVKTILKKY
ncbi:MAG: hypothetical protein JW702_10415 [Clostridiales bacterium]|nr:hypothetical protein [Clostridiales bacterium]